MRKWIFPLLVLLLPCPTGRAQETIPGMIDVPGMPPPKKGKSKRTGRSAPQPAAPAAAPEELPAALPPVPVEAPAPAPSRKPEPEAEEAIPAPERAPAEEQEIIPFPGAENLMGEDAAGAAPEAVPSRPAAKEPDPFAEAERLPAAAPAPAPVEEFPPVPAPDPVPVAEKAVREPAPVEELPPVPAPDPVPAPVAGKAGHEPAPVEEFPPVPTPDPAPAPVAEEAVREPAPIERSSVPAPEADISPELGAPVGVGGSVAVLDGIAISRAEFYQTLADLHGKEVLDRMINLLLLRSEMRRRGWTVAEADIEEAYRSQHLGRFGAEPGVEPEAVLRRQTGMDPDEYKAKVVWTELALKKIVGQKLQVTDADIFNYYWMNKTTYTKPEMVRARHILISPVEFSSGKGDARSAGPAEWNKALQAALEVQAKAKGGADFSELARTKSHDRKTSARGGDLGFFPRGVMVKPFEDAAFLLKPGQFSELVKTSYGYHLIRLEDRTPEQLQPFDQIKAQVRSHYENYLVSSQAADLLHRLRQEAMTSGRLKITQ